MKIMYSLNYLAQKTITINDEKMFSITGGTGLL